MIFMCYCCCLSEYGLCMCLWIPYPCSVTFDHVLLLCEWSESCWCVSSDSSIDDELSFVVPRAADAKAAKKSKRDKGRRGHRSFLEDDEADSSTARAKYSVRATDDMPEGAYSVCMYIWCVA